MLQIVEGLKVVHSKGVAHRDLKVENILVCYDENGHPQLKLGDFGSATKQHSIDYETSTKMEIYRFMEVIEGECTHMYRAPEMLDRWQGYNVSGPSTDIWMLGCVLYVLCTGSKHPFQDAQNLAILNAQYSMVETGNNLELLDPISPLKDMIRAILVPDPNKRLSLDQLQGILSRLKRGEEVIIALCEEAEEIKKKQLLAIQRSDPQKYDQMMDAMVE